VNHFLCTLAKGCTTFPLPTPFLNPRTMHPHCRANTLAHFPRALQELSCTPCEGEPCAPIIPASICAPRCTKIIFPVCTILAPASLQPNHYLNPSPSQCRAIFGAPIVSSSFSW
jgi:hypothetical protein